MTYLDAGDEPAESDDGPLPLVQSFDRLVTALIAAPHVEELHLSEAIMCPPSLASVGRLLRDSSLRTLDVTGLFDEGLADELTPPFGVPAPELCAGLRATRSLRSLTLKYVHLFELPEAGVAVLAAVTGHPTLRELRVSENVDALKDAAPEAERAAAGAAFAALLATDSLHTLDVHGVPLNAGGVSAMAAALGASTALKEFELTCFAVVDDAVAAELAAAVHASALIKLSCGCACTGCEGPHDTFEELARFVQRRAHERGLASPWDLLPEQLHEHGAHDEEALADEEEDGGEEDVDEE